MCLSLSKKVNGCGGGGGGGVYSRVYNTVASTLCVMSVDMVQYILPTTADSHISGGSAASNLVLRTKSKYASENELQVILCVMSAHMSSYVLPSFLWFP